jgi:phage/plasmid-associated DNA primase
MDGGIQERVETLRREIAEIQKLNLAHLQTPQANIRALYEYQRRQERLQQIMDELKSMSDWKKP